MAKSLLYKGLIFIYGDRAGVANVQKDSQFQVFIWLVFKVLSVFIVVFLNPGVKPTL